MQTLSLPDSVIRQGRFVEKDGKNVLILPPNVLQQYQENLAKQQQLQQQQQQSLLSPPPRLSTDDSGDAAALSKGLFSPSSAGGGAENSDKFELTDDYIQQTIKDALKSGNLTPELEEKLIKQLETAGVDGGGVGGVAKYRRSAATKVSWAPILSTYVQPRLATV
jgi:hypothetical protein